MFAAMHPSGPAAQSLRTRSGFSLPFLSVAGLVHGGLSHSSESSSAIHFRTSSALVQQRSNSACKAASAHSLSSIDLSSLRLVDGLIWLAGQPAKQPVNRPDAMTSSYQGEFFFPYALPKARWVDASEVAAWATWRDAVLWCWENRPNQSMQRNGDQSTFRHYCEKEYGLRVHAPHVSRWLNRDTDAPMDLPPDFVSAFESFTGWHGLTQFFNRKAKTTCLEEMQARLAA